MSKISLCLIVKNEEKLLKRCIDSFRGSFDELIIVDTGSTDNTVKLAWELGSQVYDFKWIDDFSAARQFSFDKATGDWLMWCDADDVLEKGHAEIIRQIVDRDMADIILLPYFANGHQFERERLMRSGSGRWVRTIHEKYQNNPGSKIGRCQQVMIRHLREIAPSSHSRNLQFLEKSTEETPMDLFYIASEYYRAGKIEESFRCANAALNLNLPNPERYELMMILALLSKDPKERDKYSLSAYNLMPQRREALICLCQTAISAGQLDRALHFCRALYSLPLPKEKIWTVQTQWYAWEGTNLYAYCLRRNGLHEGAFRIESASRKGELPTFSLIHASRGRPKKMIEARELWFKRASKPQMVEYIFGVDSDDALSVASVQGYQHCTVSPGGGCVAAWNEAARISCGSVLIQVSDDWIPPQNWDSILLERLGDKINQEAAILVSDGIDRGGGKITDCMCMAIMTRLRYQYQGHMFYPGYKSVYSDNEFSDRAHADGIVIDARDIVFEHLHPLVSKSEMDTTYAAQNSPERYSEGEALWKSRKVQKNSLSRDYAAFILATKDDFCLLEVCLELCSQGVKSFWFGVPTEFWNGAKNSRENLDDIKQIAQVLAQTRGVQVHLHVLDVDKHRALDRHILITESMVRNEMLKVMREAGHQHIVVVDGDELWMPGALMEIDRYIDDNAPSSLNVRMIPVVGLPGYPIEGSQDVAMAYLGPKAEFLQCRGSTGNQFIYPRRKIIHFTATRKTVDEIIQKHRESGHYTDPEYQFEHWIRNTLPNIKPGMKRAHMFTRWDTWPLVRQFTQSEWNQIPESIKPYLGEPK